MSDTTANGASKNTLNPPRIRAYREFLTPLLHRRFVSAAFLATWICYVEALILSYQSSPLTWLLFAAVFRASLLFVPALIIFLLRISQLRFGARTSASPLHTALSLLGESGTYQIIAFYFFSAWIFSEIHIHSAPYEADLGWVANGELYERLRLNEKVIYLRCHAFIVASVQALLHLKYDYSCVRLPVPTTGKEELKTGSESQTVQSRLQVILPGLFGQIVYRTLVLTIISPFIYLFVRPWAWTWSLSFARLVWNIPEHSHPGMVPPFHWSLLLRTVLQGLMMFGLSEGCNNLFSLFVAQEPIKRDKPLSSDSKDPNGSLINGLQSKKMAVRSYALWELEIIVRKFADRRKSILTELDRKGQSAWTQVLQVCLGSISAMEIRIKGSGKPKEESTSSSNYDMPSLPRIASPMKQSSVTEAHKPKDSLDSVVSFLENQARRAGESPRSAQLDLSPKFKVYVDDAKDRFLSKQQQRALSKEHLEKSAHGIIGKLLRFNIPATPFTGEFQPGLLFQQTLARRLKLTIFGSPFSEKVNIIRATDILSTLLEASVTEDTYGVVSKNVPEIWRTLVKAISEVENTMRTTGAHWTDVDFSPQMKSDLEIDELLLHLKKNLSRLFNIFSSDYSARGLTPSDLADARRAAGLDEKA